MSGTSADGVDAVLACWRGEALPEVLGHVYLPFDALLRESVLSLNMRGDDELHRAAQVATRLASLYARAVEQLLQQAAWTPQQICALGAHGQTVRHQPIAKGTLTDGPGALAEPGYTLQLLNAPWLAELTGIDVVCDFRSADVAVGGQGAPLVPAAHDSWFSRPDEDVAVLNIGGMANLSLLPRCNAAVSRQVLGFDTGPGNVLMDRWCQLHRGCAFDADGAWAATGKVIPQLLTQCAEHSFFEQAPPKSTGREAFDQTWLAQQLSHHANATLMPASPDDVQATLAELTALTIAEALKRHGPATRHLLVCGGGARNAHLMRRLTTHLAGITVQTTAAYGLPVDQVEALAFAWLARAFVERVPGNMPSVTGARRAKVLGALHPAS